MAIAVAQWTAQGDEVMATYKLDLIGYVCPVPLMQTKQKIKELLCGDTLLILTEHPRAVRNIMDWALAERYSIDIDDVENGLWQITVIKS